MTDDLKGKHGNPDGALTELRANSSDNRSKGVIKLAERYQEELSDKDIELGIHKDIIGSPLTSWEGAGGFQLHFLQERGLRKSSRLLDVGCGPGRGSEFFIPFLDKYGYSGMDHNASYIRACELMAKKKDLLHKAPHFIVSKEFQLQATSVFEFVMAFSVVQYLAPHLRHAFFSRIPQHLGQGGKLYVSHASWFSESLIEDYDVRVSRVFEEDAYDLSNFGWQDRESGRGVFPIIEFMRN